jgi:hypothetical protein
MKVSDRLCPATSAKPRGLTSGFAPSSSFHSARFSLGNGLDGVGNRAELWPDPETNRIVSLTVIDQELAACRTVIV